MPNWYIALDGLKEIWGEATGMPGYYPATESSLETHVLSGDAVGAARLHFGASEVTLEVLKMAWRRERDARVAQVPRKTA